MNNLKIFAYKTAKIEVITFNGEIYFNPYHVGAALNIKPTTVRDYLAAMNEKQAVLLTNSDVGLTDIRKLNNAGEKFLTESGVYKLVFKSRKPEAERFTDWLAEDVLPSIRKTGSYNAPKSTNEIFIQQMDVAEKFTKLTSVNVGIAASVAISEAEKLTGEDLSAWRKIIPAPFSTSSKKKSLDLAIDDRAGLVTEYLDMLLPADWATLNEHQRRDFFKQDAAGNLKKGVYPRGTVSRIEIWAECFGQSRADMSSKDSYAISSILENLGGWERQEKAERIPLYGLQRLYKRMTV